LFGSRAKGNCTEKSDVDIAVSGGNFDQFYFDVQENMHSLLSFDIINLDQGISEELRKEIRKDGITLYEKT
jgi:predicted nucleotidyltransferase